MTDKLFKALIEEPPSRDNERAQVETARKRIAYTLLFYTGVGVNEITNLTYEDVIGFIEQGRLKLVLDKQKKAITRFIPDVGRNAMNKLMPEIELFFKETGATHIAQSFEKAGKVMPKKSRIQYINREINKVAKAHQIPGIFNSHPFRLPFFPRCSGTRRPTTLPR